MESVLQNNRFESQAHIAAPREEVFAVLTDIGSTAYSPSRTYIQRLTPGPVGVGTKWIESRRALFLRETLTLEVLEFEPCEKYCVSMDDGCNLVKYSFKLEAGQGNMNTVVRCTVDCHMRLGIGWSGPSEKLARMMEKHDGPLLQRLKGYVELNSGALQVY